MGKVGFVSVQGVSGNTYFFDVWTAGATYPDCGGIFLPSRLSSINAHSNANPCDIFYIEETARLNDAIGNHPKWAEWGKSGVDMLLILQEDDPQKRHAIYEDVREYYQGLL